MMGDFLGITYFSISGDLLDDVCLEVEVVGVVVFFALVFVVDSESFDLGAPLIQRL